MNTTINPNRPTDAQLEVLRGQFLVYKSRWSTLRDAEAVIREATRTAASENVGRYLADVVARDIADQIEGAEADLSDAAGRFEAALELYRKLR